MPTKIPLWKCTSKQSGKEYIRGKWGVDIIRIFANTFKQEEHQPDFYMIISHEDDEKAYKKKEGKVSPASSESQFPPADFKVDEAPSAPGEDPGPTEADGPEDVDSIDDDDLPF